MQEQVGVDRRVDVGELRNRIIRTRVHRGRMTHVAVAVLEPILSCRERLPWRNREKPNVHRARVHEIGRDVDARLQVVVRILAIER